MATATVRLASVDCSGPDAAKNILSVRHWLKVIGIDARTVSALVVQLHSSRNRAVNFLPLQSVHLVLLPASINYAVPL
jgi:hypothetical protein